MTRVKYSRCPWCFKRHDRVSGVAPKGTASEPVAKDGDVTFCVYCLQPSIFDSSIKSALRFPTQEEIEEIRTDPFASKVLATLTGQKAIRPVKRRPDWAA